MHVCFSLNFGRFDESLSLKNIGLSNVCLASLASKGERITLASANQCFHSSNPVPYSDAANNKIDNVDAYLHEPTKLVF